MNGHLEIIKTLLTTVKTSTSEAEQSAYLSLKNNAGHDAAYEAETAGKDDVVTFLLGAMDEADVGAGVNEDKATAEDESGMEVDGAGPSNAAAADDDKMEM